MQPPIFTLSPVRQVGYFFPIRNDVVVGYSFKYGDVFDVLNGENYSLGCMESPFFQSPVRERFLQAIKAKTNSVDILCLFCA